VKENLPFKAEPMPYGLFAIDALGQEKQVGLLIAKPEDKAFKSVKDIIWPFTSMDRR